ncbi:hypothetical protein [Halorhabdus sp. CUG00001]|uniref:hypothetical protein n=1 Tax=Halorhabdus sp. CUG00001 TaxID=2600297 RepID=UPI00131BEE60|nr:hypothetical protein [Halorhabdus sp. CUG00001]
MADRRQFLTAVGSALGVASILAWSGPGVLDGTEPTHPGGTVVIENVANQSVRVSITVLEDDCEAALETTVPGGETQVYREFVAAEAGTVLTLAAHLGDSGSPKTMEFLPAGGETNAHPEVARLTIHNAVEGDADWIVEPGTR